MKLRFRVAMAPIGVLALYGCGGEGTDSSTVKEVVYVDQESRQMVVMPHVEDAPAVNPATGRRTLMPGLYCPQCQDWHPTPPLEALQRNPAARRCPKCQSALTADGPAPAAITN
jgi:predicted Zn-ribbon and HTH transcriptional regulator